MTATTTGGIPAAGEDGCGEDRSAPAAARMCTATTATGDGDDGDLDRSGDDGDHEGSGGTAPSHPLLSPLPDQSEGRRPSPGRTGVGRTDPPGRRRGCARRPRRKRRRHALPSPPLPSPRSVRGEEAVAGEDGRGEDGSARPAVRMCTATTKKAAAPRPPIPSSPLSQISPRGGGRRRGGRAWGGRIRPAGGADVHGDHEESGGATPSHPLLSPLPDQSEGRRPSPGRTGVGRTDPPGRRCGCARRPRRKRRRHALPSPPLPSPRSVRGEEAVAGEDGRGEDGSARPAARMCTATTKKAAAPRPPIPSSPLSHICPMGGGRRWGGRARGGRIRPGGGRRLEEHGSAPAVARGARPRGLDLVTTDAVGPRAVVLGFL
uniref:Uncharacterized protein n=1 Tax=Oryza rufipogon TaxID=4529 RepID=A0A0E0QFW8_ORYRU